MKRVCAACGYPRSKFLFEKDGYSILRCKNCCFEFVDFQPGDGFTSDFYTKDYFVDGHDKCGYADYLQEKPNLMRSNIKRVRFIENYVSGGSILDVGCSAGFFLEALGPRWDPYGCEPSGAMVEFAREKFGERITRAALEEYEPGRTFDVITMWDCLEHTVEPNLFIRKALSLLKDDGFLFLGTPDAGSPAPRVLGRYWYYYVPPSHLQYFDRWNIEIFLERNGFRMRRLVYFAKYVSLAEIVANLGYMFGNQGMKQLSERLLRLSRWNVSIPYMVFDDMVVMARKRTRFND